MGGLSATTDNNSLHSHFESCGEIEEATVIYYHGLERSRGFGFVLFVNVESVEEAMRQCPHIIDNKEVEIKRAFPKVENTNDNGDKKKRRRRKKKKSSSQSTSSPKPENKSSNHNKQQTRISSVMDLEEPYNQMVVETSILYPNESHMNSGDMSYFEYYSSQPLFRRTNDPSPHPHFSPIRLGDVRLSTGSVDRYRLSNRLALGMNPVRCDSNSYYCNPPFPEETYQRDWHARDAIDCYGFSDKPIYAYVPCEHTGDHMDVSNQRSQICYDPNQNSSFGMIAHEYPPSLSSPLLRSSTHKRYF